MTDYMKDFLEYPSYKPGDFMDNPKPLELDMKFDGGKDKLGVAARTCRYSLNQVKQVLAKGAEKYEEDSYRQVKGAMRRYHDAMERHIDAWLDGEGFDPEFGTHHLANAAANLLFLMELEKDGRTFKED